MGPVNGYDNPLDIMAAKAEQAKKVEENKKDITELWEEITRRRDRFVLSQIWKNGEPLCYADHVKNQFGIHNSKPKDSASQLTQRLVAATGQFEVRQVVADAGSNLIQLRLIAAIGKDGDAQKARAYIKKLERLLDRAGRKIKDLDNEELLRVRKKKAEQKRMQKRAEQIKEELRKKQIARLARENSYLLDDLHDRILGPGIPGRRKKEAADSSAAVDGVTEAAISAEAESIAAAEIAVESAAPSGDSGGAGELSAGDSGGEGAAVPENGGEG